MVLNPATSTSAVLTLFACSVLAQTPIDFGDDSSTWANDGECDDPRFAGQGVADTLLDEDLYGDATDCRTLYEQGLVALRDSASTQDEVTGGRVERGRLEAGDSTLVSGEYEDVYSFEATNGGDVVIDVRSEAFDTYLMLRTPSGD